MPMRRFDAADIVADIFDIVGKLVHWSIDKAGVDILLDDGNVPGFEECRLSWTDLSRWLKPDGPLPPR
jgi:hypothetical protein